MVDDTTRRPLKLNLSKEWCMTMAEREGDHEIGAGAIPRRAQIQQWTAAERAIFDAVQVVEAMPADPRLTDAVALLQKARDRVADYVDGVAP